VGGRSRRIAVFGVGLAALLLLGAAPTLATTVVGGSPAGLAQLRSSVVTAGGASIQAVDSVTITPTVATYPMTLDGVDYDVFDGWYVVPAGPRVQDLWVKFELVRNVDDVVVGEQWAPTSDYILNAGDYGTFQLLMKAPSGNHLRVAAVVGQPSISGEKRLGITDPDFVDHGTYRSYEGTVTNDLPVPVDVSSIRISGYETDQSTGTIFDSIFDDVTYEGDATHAPLVLAPGDSARFTAKAYRPADGVTLGLGAMRADATIATRLSFAVSDRMPVYGRSVKFTGSLMSSPDWYIVPGETLQLFASTDLKSWTSTYVVAGTSTYSLTLTPRQRSVYRWWFPGDSNYAMSQAPRNLEVYPRHFLSTPSAPPAVYRYRRFPVRGQLRPRHASQRLKVIAYHREGTRWVLRQTVSARLVNPVGVTAYSTYLATLSLPYRGGWRVRTWVGPDAQHAANYSAYRYISVR